MEMGNSGNQLAKQILSNKLNITVYATLIRELLTLWMILLQVCLHEFKNRFTADISLLLEIPGCDLSQVCHLKNQVKIVVIVIIDHLIQLGHVRMV